MRLHTAGPKNRLEGDLYAEMTDGNSCGTTFLTARNILSLHKLLYAFVQVKFQKCAIRSKILHKFKRVAASAPLHTLNPSSGGGGGGGG